MTVPISPGVYTTIVPLESYVQQVPSSTGFFTIFSDKGPDNKMIYVNDINTFYKMYGAPNYEKYKPYGSAHLIAFNFIQNSPTSYVIRLLPDNATYSNKTMFFVVDKPQMFQLTSGSVTISVNQQGQLSVTFDTPVSNVSGNPVKSGTLSWDQVDQEQGQSTLGKLMAMIKLGETSVYVDGRGIFTVVTPNGVKPSGSINLYDSKGNLTGAVTISENISIQGTGSVTYNATDTSWGILYLVDRDLTYTYDMTITPNDVLPDGTSMAITSKDLLNLSNIEFKFNNFIRPKYAIDNFVLDYGIRLDQNRYSCVIRPRLVGEQVLNKSILLVPDSYAKVLNQYISLSGIPLAQVLNNINNYKGQTINVLANLVSATYNSSNNDTSVEVADPNNSSVTYTFTVSGNQSSLQKGEYIIQTTVNADGSLTADSFTLLEPPVWYIATVTIDPNTNLPQLNVEQLPEYFNLLTEKLYETIIAGNQYALQYNTTTNSLEWEKLATFVPGHEMMYVFEYAQPLYTILAKYRGSYYNNYKIQYNEVVNKLDTYELVIYEKKNDGTTTVPESLEISFIQGKKDSSGNSLFIRDVIETYSDIIEYYSWSYQQPDINVLKELGIVYDIQPVNSVDEITEFGTYYIENNAEVRVGNNIDYTQLLNQVVVIGQTQQGVEKNVVVSYNVSPGLIMYDKKNNSLSFITDALNIGTGILENIAVFTNSANKYSYLLGMYLESGSEGELIVNGQFNQVIADQLLVQAYSGLIDGAVTNTDLFWFDLVFDGGYSTVVKNAIVDLVDKRQDCIAILDNGDNLTPQAALQARRTKHSYNDEFVALYEPYIQVYDMFSGKYVWISPVYEMAELIAKNDRVHDVWYAVAGFKRGNATDIRNLRYLISQDDRDNFYLNQINPFVMFKEGTVMWGQLTTLKQNNALQDLNVMRLVLYVKRAIQNFCQNYIFDFNDDTTRKNIQKAIVSFLKDVQARRGLYDFSVSVTADAYAIMRKMIYVDVTLQPTKVIEKIMLTFSVG